MMQHPGTFWKYVWDTNRLAYFNLSWNTLFLLFSIVFNITFGIIFFGLMLVFSVVLTFFAYRLWLERIDIADRWKEISND